MCIRIHVLKFYLLYLITECGFLIQWCLLAGKNPQKWVLFVRVSVYVSLFKRFSCRQFEVPRLSIHAAYYPRKSPKLNVNIQHLSVWVYLLAFRCCDWPLKIVPLSRNALVLALIIFKIKWAIEFFIWFIRKLVLLVFARIKQLILSATRMCTKMKLYKFHNLNFNFVQYFHLMHVYLNSCKINEFLMFWSLG